MTCRVARSYSNPTQPKDLVACCKCGPTYLKVFHSSKTLGPYLCQNCTKSMVECQVSKIWGLDYIRSLVPS
jgi:hypothetical protein